MPGSVLPRTRPASEALSFLLIIGSANLHAVPFLRIEEAGDVTLAVGALQLLLVEHSAQMSRADQASLRRTATSLMAGFAESTAAWQDADEATVRFVSHALPCA